MLAIDAAQPPAARRRTARRLLRLSSAQQPHQSGMRIMAARMTSPFWLLNMQSSPLSKGDAPKEMSSQPPKNPPDVVMHTLWPWKKSEPLHQVYPALTQSLQVPGDACARVTCGSPSTSATSSRPRASMGDFWLFGSHNFLFLLFASSNSVFKLMELCDEWFVSAGLCAV